MNFKKRKKKNLELYLMKWLKQGNKIKNNNKFQNLKIFNFNKEYNNQNFN